MRVEIAGIPFEVRCRFMDPEAFFKDYRTDREPQFAIEPTDEDLQQMQMRFNQKRKKEGKSSYLLSSGGLENYSILYLLAKELVSHNVLTVHGSALCKDEEAYVFIARSGMGKSTHARLWREAFGDHVWMINDDMPMLRIDDTGVTVFGTPWDGKSHLSRNASAPLKSIAWLRRGRSNRMEPMSAAEAFRILIQQVTGSTDPTIMSHVLQLEARLLEAVPFFKLNCTISEDAALTAWQGMNKGKGETHYEAV